MAKNKDEFTVKVRRFISYDSPSEALQAAADFVKGKDYIHVVDTNMDFDAELGERTWTVSVFYNELNYYE